MRKITRILPILLLSIFLTVSLCAAADGEPCAGKGLTIKNLSIVDVWYKSSNGECIKLKRNYSFVVGPEDKVGVFSDMICKTLYCSSQEYSDYISFDENGDCRIRFLPGCVLSDI
ncbi:MAG: hypothetical protein AB1442_09280 [Nitrospirota bacterium]